MDILKNFDIILYLGMILNLLDQLYTFWIRQISALVEGIVHSLYEVEVFFIECESVLFHFGQIK